MENAMIKNSVIMELNDYNNMMEELQELRKVKLCKIYINETSNMYGYSLPTIDVESIEDIKKIIQEELNLHFKGYEKIIERYNEQKKELDEMKSDNYIKDLRSENYDLRESNRKNKEFITKLEKSEKNLKEELEYLKKKK